MLYGRQSAVNEEDLGAGMSSSDAVNTVRKTLNAQKAGHGGTLDPLATGILPNPVSDIKNYRN